MRNTLFIICSLCCLVSIRSLAQSPASRVAGRAGLSGAVVDTFNKRELPNTVVSLIRAKDSVYYRFTRTDEKGRFHFTNLAAGDYIFSVSRASYVNYLDRIVLSDTSAVQLGAVRLTLAARILEDVVVRQQVAAIRMKGDTTEFTADSFKLREGATVEDLLKRMPGFSVDKDGKVTAQGQNVEKVLVDGEEFFGDDPTVATKNLQASVVDKVQVFDKKSDQAAFTGIDDGKTKKTINLKLKESAKHGYFGKLDLAGGPDDKWNNTAMYNRFRGNLKASVYGIMSSTGKTGLSWQESNTYGNGDDDNYWETDDGFNYQPSSDPFASSSFRGQGIPKNWNIGFNFANKFNNDKQHLNGSYRYGKINTEGGSETTTQSLLADSSFLNRETQQFRSTQDRHSANGVYEWQVDSSASFKVTASGYTGTNENNAINSSEDMNGKGITVNRSKRSTVSLGGMKNLKSNWTFRKRFARPGRTISFSVDQLYNSSNSNGQLYSLVSYYNPSTGASLKDSLTDQKKMLDGYSSSVTSKAVYTEPLSKKVFIEANYALRVTNSTSERYSYNKDASGKYSVYDPLYSNHYDFNTLTNTAGLAFKYNGKKLTATVGSDVAFSEFKQHDVVKDSFLNRSYTNFFPRASMTWKLGPTGSQQIRLNYTGSTRQPTITQLQPIPDNSNPLYITIGNPYLKQSFVHQLNFNYNSQMTLKQRYFNLYGNVMTTANAIVSSNYIDSVGRTVNQYINVNGNYNGYLGSNYNMRFNKIDVGVYFGPNLNISRYNNVVNSRSNTTTTFSYGIGMGAWKSKEKKYDFNLYGNLRENTSQSSINTAIKTSYLTAYFDLSGTVFLPGKFEIRSELEGNLREKTSAFDQNNNVFLLSAYIGRKLFKGDKGLIKIEGNDLLNQNKGYSRNITNNVLVENSYQTIQRYFTIGFVWNFSNNPLSASK